MTDGHRDPLSDSAGPVSAPLDPTGVPGLDVVLGGGLQRGSLVIIAGPPGGGKTILAHHIAFSAARVGRRTTILTAFSEPTNKLLAHMRPFAFFDQELVGQTVDVLSIQQFLRQGMAQAADEIIGMVRAAKAELVVLDGFRGIREMAEHPDEARRFMYEVSNLLNLLGITLLVTSEANVRDVAFFPEATTADALLGLAFDAINARERRTLEALKVRGVAPLAGQHALTISDIGVTIHPRLEARVAHLAGVNRPFVARPVSMGDGSGATESATDGAVDAEASSRAARSASERIGCGIPGLDALLGGGLAAGTSTLVMGMRGAGKTLFGLQFALQGVRAGERAAFVGFRETERQLVRKARPFRWGVELTEALQSGALTMLRTPPVELRVDVLADHLLALLDATDTRRLVVDEIGELASALAASGYAPRYHDFIAALLEALRQREITTLFLTSQVAISRSRTVGSGSDGIPVSALTDNLLWLRQTLRGNRFARSLTMLQTDPFGRSNMRFPVTIQPPEGIAVLPSATADDEWHAMAAAHQTRPPAGDMTDTPGADGEERFDDEH
jgi:circadian clock protein KaiC